MNDSLVSIIIPCFRQGHLLTDAVESALVQSYPGIEVVVVNDGSDDNTDQVALGFGQRIVYVQKKNGGLSAARNSGISVARGRYLNFLDADDLLSPDAIAELMSAMAGAEERLVVGGYRMFRETPCETDCVEYLPPPTLQPFPLFLHGNVGPPHTLLSSRSMLNKTGGFRESMRRGAEDWDTWLRIVFGGAELVGVPKCVAYYRRYAGSMSTQHHNLLSGRTEVLQFTHEEFKRRPELLSAYGNELLAAEHRVLRRWLASDYDRSWIPRLTQMIRELDERGFRLNRSAARRSLDRWLGLWSDRLALAYFKMFRPQQFQFYLDGPN